MLIDSHCHLNFPEFSDDLEETIRRAQESNVNFLLTVNTRLEEAKDLQKIADLYPFIVSSVGVHPHEAKNYTASTLEQGIIELTQHPKVVALGETGLDYYYEHSDPKVQKASFEIHLQQSHSLDLPVIIHTRQADDDTIACLKNFPDTQGVFHCFSGSRELAKKSLDLGFFISFSGIITFKNAEDLRETLRYVPLDRLLIETDSPFLAPIPHRGKRNEPAFVKYVGEKVGEILKLSLEDVQNFTTKNFFKLFRKAQTFRPKKDDCLSLSSQHSLLDRGENP